MRSLGQSLVHRGAAGAPPAVTTPDQIADLQAWWKAAAITGLADGDPVAAWPDSSGHGHTLAQANLSQQPLWRAAQRRGRPAVCFDGLDDCLAGGGVCGLPMTALMVWQQSAWGLSNQRMLLSGDEGQLVVQQALIGAYPDLHCAELMLHQPVDGSFRFPLFSYGLLTLTGAPGSDGLTTFTVRVNADSEQTVPTFDAGLDSLVVLGASFDFINNGRLDVAELAIYHRALSGSEQAALRAYFNDQYALW